MEEHGLTQEEAAQRVGKSRPAVANALRLLGLCPAVMELVEKGTLSAGHARSILPLRSELQRLAANKIRLEMLSVRQAETLAAKMAREDAKDPIDDQIGLSEVVVDYVKEVEQELSAIWGRGVKLISGRKKGRIEIEFYDEDDREALIASLREKA
jgi:ParB family chromosome partitioning protein